MRRLAENKRSAAADRRGMGCTSWGTLHVVIVPSDLAMKSATTLLLVEIDAPSPVGRGAAADVRDLKSASFYIV